MINLIHHIRFADDIVLIIQNIEQAERILADFDRACRKVGLQLNLMKTMFTKNALVLNAPFLLNETNITECSSYKYLDREINMTDD